LNLKDLQKKLLALVDKVADSGTMQKVANKGADLVKNRTRDGAVITI